MRKKLNIYSTKTIVCNMQRRHVALGNNPPTPPTYKSIFTEDPSPVPPPPHVSAHTHRSSRNTITSLSLLVWGEIKIGEALKLQSPALPPPGLPSSVREGRRGFGAVVPLVHLGVVYLHRVKELVSVEAAHGVDCVAQHGHARIAARRCHTAQHLPIVAGGVVHLHAAKSVGAVEAADNKQFAYREPEMPTSGKSDQERISLKGRSSFSYLWTHLHERRQRPLCEPHSWELSESRCCSRGCSAPRCSGNSTTLPLRSRT